MAAVVDGVTIERNKMTGMTKAPGPPHGSLYTSIRKPATTPQGRRKNIIFRDNQCATPALWPNTVFFYHCDNVTVTGNRQPTSYPDFVDIQDCTGVTESGNTTT